MTIGDIHAIRKMAPFQNHFMLNPIFNMGEEWFVEEGLVKDNRRK
jgi:hypothetical protein